MVITPHHLVLVRTSWQWRDIIITTIIVVIIIRMKDHLELPPVLLMHPLQASSNSNSMHSSMAVVTSHLLLLTDTPGTLPAIMATPTSNGNSTKAAAVENIDRTMVVVVVVVGTQIITMVQVAMAIEGRGIIGCPLLGLTVVPLLLPKEVAPIIIIIIISTTTPTTTLAVVETVLEGGVRGMVEEVTEVISTMVENTIVTMTSGAVVVVGVTMIESDTGDEKLAKIM